MIATSKIEMDLNWYSRPKIEAIQDDKYSRNVEISMTTDGTPWEIPYGARAVARYVKSDGTGGEYDTMPNGETAWSASGNVLTIKLAPQVLTVAGTVVFMAMLIFGETEISTFTITINVHRLPGFSASSEDYINMRTWLVSELETAMAQAKESGEFDGPAGRGIKSITGNADGSWTVAYSDGTTKTVSSEAYTALTTQLRQLSLEIAGKIHLSPEFANSTEECTDTSKVYVLPDGYIYAYLPVVSGDYTNQLPLSVDTDGSLYENGHGWKADTRLNSRGVEVTHSGIECTGFIPVKRGDVIRFKNVKFVPDGDYKGQQYTAVYNSNKEKLVAFISNVLSGDYEGAGAIERDEYGNVILLKTDGLDTTNSYAFPENTAFVRFSMEEITDDSIITVNEEIIGTAGTGAAGTYQWQNTGHAFVPTDYEDRIISIEKAQAEQAAEIITLKKAAADLEESVAAIGTTQDYVGTEADEVIDRVIAAQGARTFTFAAITDLHHGNGGYVDGIAHACQALKYIDSRIKLDAVAVLGDYTDGLATTGYDGAIKDMKEINNLLDGLRFAPNIRTPGNHDFYESHSPIFARYIQAYSDDVVWGDRMGGYYYRDFEDFQLRIICLNTAEENATGLSCSVAQYNWFIESLDLSAKDTPENWQVLVLSHHPLDWFPGNDGSYLFWQILDAYLNGESWSNSAATISCNYAGKNAAKIIGNIHGHIHNLLVRDIAAGQPNKTEDTIPVKRIATPEACYGRTNTYNGSWEYNPFGEETDYPKTQNAAEDTAFCIYCVDLDSNTVKAICYGAGYDREISY